MVINLFINGFLVREILFNILLLSLFPPYALGSEGEEAPEPKEEVWVFDLGKAVSRALNANRQILSNIDNLWKAEFGKIIAESEFDIKVIPHGKSGYIGGGSDGVGLSVGAGVDLRKKFTHGGTMTFTPSLLKTPERYYTDLRAVITQPLLRGFSQAYQLSGILGAQFFVRSAYRNLYLAQQQLVIRTITALYEITKSEKALELYQNSHVRVAHFY